MKRRIKNRFQHLEEKFGTRFYGFDGKRMSLGHWVSMTEGRSQTVSSTLVRGKGRTYWVSTVLLGIDYSFGRNPKPEIFETAIFLKPGGLLDIPGRYTNIQQARAGHRAVCAQIREELAHKTLLHKGRKP